MNYIKKLLFDIASNLLYSEYATKIKRYLLVGESVELYLYPERYKNFSKDSDYLFTLCLECFDLKTDFLNEKFDKFIEKLNLPIKNTKRGPVGSNVCSIIYDIVDDKGEEIGASIRLTLSLKADFYVPHCSKYEVSLDIFSDDFKVIGSKHSKIQLENNLIGLNHNSNLFIIVNRFPHIPGKAINKVKEYILSMKSKDLFLHTVSSIFGRKNKNHNKKLIDFLTEIGIFPDISKYGVKYNYNINTKLDSTRAEFIESLLKGVRSSVSQEVYDEILTKVNNAISY